jgi:hypothetical protein
VVAADADPQSPGFHSRYTAGRILYPPPGRDARAAVERLRWAARHHRVELLIPVTDEVLLPLSAAREAFAGICALALPEPDVLAVAEDKGSTIELAARLGCRHREPAWLRRSRRRSPQLLASGCRSSSSRSRRDCAGGTARSSRSR